jgi:hypothetical protein
MSLRQSLVVTSSVLAIAACGGADSSDFFGGGAAGTSFDAGGTQPAPGGGNGDDGGRTSGDGGGGTQRDAGDPTPCTTVFYRDKDRDGFGNPNAQQTACSAPGSDWVTKAGDCNDDSEQVFTGQSKFFAQPYSRSGGSGSSFDYDCSGSEEQGSVFTKASTCTVVGNGTGCAGAGYLPAQPLRTGPGVDPYCGSTRYQTCRLDFTGQNVACVATVRTDAEPLGCH